MGFATTVLLACLGAVGVFLAPFWISRRTTDPTITSSVDPILGAKDQASIHDIDTSFILTTGTQPSDRNWLLFGTTLIKRATWSSSC